jgi:aspartate racemase
MKEIGIVGGVSWRSTVELCRRSEERGRARNLPNAPLTPEIAIESLDHNRAVAPLGHGDDDGAWLAFDAYHRDALERMKASGAEVALIASNTPHHRFESIIRGIGIPVLSTFATAAQAAARMHVRRVLILGTRSTMSSPRLRRAFAEYGIDDAGPGDEPASALTVALTERLQHGLVAGIVDASCRDDAQRNRAPVLRPRRCLPGRHGTVAGISSMQDAHHIRIRRCLLDQHNRGPH